MRKLALVPIFVLLLGGVQAVVLDSHIYAKHVLWHCCTAGMCNSKCYCCYQNFYCGCVVPDDDAIHSDVHAADVTVNIRGSREPRAFAVSKLNADDRLQVMMSSRRARNHFALRVLDGYENGLKVWCPGTAANTEPDEKIAFNNAEKEKQ
jgi:hypothetical protein